MCTRCKASQLLRDHIEKKENYEEKQSTMTADEAVSSYMHSANAAEGADRRSGPVLRAAATAAAADGAEGRPGLVPGLRAAGPPAAVLLSAELPTAEDTAQRKVNINVTQSNTTMTAEEAVNMFLKKDLKNNTKMGMHATNSKVAISRVPALGVGVATRPQLANQIVAESTSIESRKWQWQFADGKCQKAVDAADCNEAAISRVPVFGAGVAVRPRADDHSVALNTISGPGVGDATSAEAVLLCDAVGKNAEASAEVAVSRVPVLGAGVAVRPLAAVPGLTADASGALPADASGALAADVQGGAADGWDYLRCRSVTGDEPVPGWGSPVVRGAPLPMSQEESCFPSPGGPPVVFFPPPGPGVAHPSASSLNLPECLREGEGDVAGEGPCEAEAAVAAHAAAASNNTNENGQSGECVSTEAKHGIAMSNTRLLQKWKILPLHMELHARRVRWLKATLQRPWDNEQVTAAIFGSMEVTGNGAAWCLPSLDEAGHLCSSAPALAFAFQDALLAYEGISGTESFFEAWSESGRSWKVLLISKPLQLLLDKLDAKLLLAAFVADASMAGKACSAKVVEEDWICMRPCDKGVCGCKFGSKAALLSHQYFSIVISIQ